MLYYREEKCTFLGVLASLAPTHESEFQISDSNITCFNNLKFFLSVTTQFYRKSVQFVGSFLSSVDPSQEKKLCSDITDIYFLGGLKYDVS